MNYEVDLELKCRNNKDKVVSSFGHNLLNLCQSSGLRIVNGRKLGDSFGELTCHKKNGSSTVDYALVPKELFCNILSFQVLNYLEAISNHCPIALTLNISLLRDSFQSESLPTIPGPKKVKWEAPKFLSHPCQEKTYHDQKVRHMDNSRGSVM